MAGKLFKMIVKHGKTGKPYMRYFKTRKGFNAAKKAGGGSAVLKPLTTAQKAIRRGVIETQKNVNNITDAAQRIKSTFPKIKGKLVQKAGAKSGVTDFFSKSTGEKVGSLTMRGGFPRAKGTLKLYGSK